MNFQYFKQLNYTMANEDTSLELELLPSKAGHVFSVAGSGSRVLPLLAKHPRKVTCVDLSQEQLYLTELRMESARRLEHSEFLAFWGYPPRIAKPKERKEFFEKFHLSLPAYGFCLSLFETKQWESILYEGKWEKAFAKISRIIRKMTGSKGSGFFEAKTPSEHFQYLEEKFPNKAWSLAVFLLGNAVVFNTLLYKGQYPKKNIPGSMYRFYHNSFDRLFAQGQARGNFFLQYLFLGEIRFSEGNPVECDPKVFAEVKKGLEQTEIHYCLGDICKQAQKVQEPIDFFSFSDVPSYFCKDQEKTFLQQISPSLAPGALVIVRNYLHVPEGTDTAGYENVTDFYHNAIDLEKMQVYLIDVYRRTYDRI